MTKHPDVLKLSIQVLRRYTFLQMLLAQIYKFCGWEGLQKKRLHYAEAMFTLSTEVMRHIDDYEFLQIEADLADGLAPVEVHILLIAVQCVFSLSARSPGAALATQGGLLL